MIDFEHVSKEYKKGGRLALEDINLHVDDGEFVFLLGHSGAGKSTLLKLILREELPTSGKVTVLGKDVALTPFGRHFNGTFAVQIPGSQRMRPQHLLLLVPAGTCNWIRFFLSLSSPFLSLLISAR